MKRMVALSKFGLLMLALEASMSCSPGFKIDDRVKGAIQDNFSATDYESWSVSSNHPNRLFEALRDEVRLGRNAEAVSVELCQSLKSISEQALMLFETEIFDVRNEEILKFCLSNLRAKLNKKHLQNRQEFKDQGYAVLDDHKEKVQKQVETKGSTEVARVTKLENQKEQIQFKIIYRDLSKGPRMIDGSLPHKHVALTFDDGPSPNFTSMVAQALEERGVRAHFFMLGNQVKANPHIAKRVANQGHSIGNHTVTHPCLGSVTQCKSLGSVGFETGVREIVTNHRILYDIVGFVDPIFRFPYGASTPELRQFLKENQTAEFFWNIDSNDWRANQTNQDVLNRTMAQLNDQQKGILLFHDIHRRTAEMLPELLARLARQDYTVVLILSSDETSRYKHPFLDGSYRF
jgi:peptidoglycan/xylan/chitin deacetylase (PgdA/CDA1 family)